MTQPVEELKIIQLRENAIESDNFNDGDWCSMIKTPLTIQEGESLVLKNAFIAESNATNPLITLESDFELTGQGDKNNTTIEAVFGYYVMDYYSNFPAPDAGGNPVPNKIYVSPQKQYSGEPFIMMANSQPEADSLYLSQFQLQVVKDKNWGPSGGDYPNTSVLMIEVTYYIPDVGHTPPYKAVSKVIVLDTWYEDDQGNAVTLDTYCTTIGTKYFCEISWDSINEFGDDGAGNNHENGLVFPSTGDPNNPNPGAGIVVSKLALDAGLPIIKVRVDAHTNSQTSSNPEIRDVLSASNQGYDDQSIAFRQVSFKLPSKDYEPNELSTLISAGFEELSAPTGGSATWRMSDNELLLNTQQIKAELTNGNQPTFMSLDRQQQFNFIDTVDGDAISYLIGSSQFALTYDDVAQKFQLGSIHSSRYTNDGSKCIDAYVNADNKKVYLNKYSGIYLTDLKPLNLWIGDKDTPNSMRFASSLLTSVGSHTSTINGTTPLQSYSAPDFLTDGINITGDLGSIDTFVIKALDTTNKRHYDTAPSFSDYPPFQDIINMTDGIMSQALSSTAESGDLDGGYYLIEVDCGINQDFRADGIFNNKIKAIVSRFYNQSNYISSAEDSGIVYTHKGSVPLTLSRFRIRVLSPDGTLAKDVKKGSAIFLQVVTQK